MRRCSCEKPARSSNPRNADLCNRCLGKIPAPSKACDRCHAPVDLHGSYVIGYHKSSRPMEWRHLCDECSGDLRLFMREVPL